MTSTNLEAQLRAMGTGNTVPDMEQMDALLIRAADEIKGNRAALKVAQQSLLEFSHAQEYGPSWYTRGANGMYQQVNLWLQRGLEAVQGALGPYDDNGQYLKERPAAEQRSAEYDRALEAHARQMHPGVPIVPADKSATEPEQLPINRALVHALGFCVIPLPQGFVTVENRSPDPVVVTVDRATVKSADERP